MPFASLSDFNKWHKSIQYRYNAGAQTGLPSPGGRTKAVAQHTRTVLPRPHAPLAKARQTGAELSHSRCDITKGSRHQMAQRGTTSDMPSKSGSIPPEPTPDKEAE